MQQQDQQSPEDLFQRSADIRSKISELLKKSGEIHADMNAVVKKNNTLVETLIAATNKPGDRK